MAFDKLSLDKQSVVRKKAHDKEIQGSQHKMADPVEIHELMSLQNQIGNHVVQTMVVQRQGSASFELDDDTTSQINRVRGGGQALDSTMQIRMNTITEHDLSQVKVHTSPEANQLSEQLNAKAFTTGQDIFFQEGAYQPHSGEGQELLAHELTHVVQQSSGAVSSGDGGMTVNAPGDRFEQEADAVAQAVSQAGHSADIQRQALEEDEEIGPDQLELGPEEEDEIG